jgi:hypothetical protein
MRSRLLLLPSIIAASLTAAPAIASAQGIVRGDRFYDRHTYTRYDIDERVERTQRRAAERAARDQERARERRARAYATRLRVDRDRDYLRDERMTRVRERARESRARAQWRVRW